MLSRRQVVTFYRLLDAEPGLRELPLLFWEQGLPRRRNLRILSELPRLKLRSHCCPVFAHLGLSDRLFYLLLRLSNE